MSDESYLDMKYFIDDEVYNCPFCNRRNVRYKVSGNTSFNWSSNKTCHIWLVECSSCEKTSMHLTYSDIRSPHYYKMRDDIDDIDSHIFYSVPTSFFVIDSRIPLVIRELITEAEGCVKMNFLTGASACTRKAIYELIVAEDAKGENYEDRIKSLKLKYKDIDAELFNVLSHIQDMTSDKIHEQSWDKWDSHHLKLFLETLKAILHEIYVVPEERKKRSLEVQKLLTTVKSDQKSKTTGTSV